MEANLLTNHSAINSQPHGGGDLLLDALGERVARALKTDGLPIGGAPQPVGEKVNPHDVKIAMAQISPTPFSGMLIPNTVV